MGYFGEAEVKRVELAAEGYWVDVKSKLKYGEVKGFINVAKDGAANAVASLDAFLQTAIVDWNLDDNDGNKAPIDQAHLDQLDQNDAIAIINAAGATAAGDVKADADFLGQSEASTQQDQSQTPPAS